MHRERLVRIVCTSLLVVGLHTAPARADVDLNGHFIGAVGAVLGFGPFPCSAVDFVQTGTSISLTAICTVFGTATFTASGTIDPMTGAVHATGQGSILCMTPGSLVIDGNGTPDGYRFFANVTCGFPANIAATRCGNGVLDPGESQTCDDAAAAGLPSLAFPGCCTDHCEIQPNGTSCVSNGVGGLCDAPDHCDGVSGVCPDLRAPDFTPCDDGNLCTINDECVGGVCHGGLHAPAGTNCIPGNDDPCIAGLCDSAGACQILFTTNPCDDFDACTTNDVCDGHDNCVGTPVNCGPCRACDSSAGCVPSVAQGCKKTLASKAKIAIMDAVPDTMDRVTWKWTHGQATTTGELGDPLTADDYALCVFDREGGTDHLLMSALAPHGAKWVPNAKGFKYKDTTGVPGGIESITLKAGADGKAKIGVKGRGANLGLPAILSGVTVPVTVQLLGPGGACWDAGYPVAQTSTPVSFKATGGGP